jgi:serine/threonine-protein kinase
VSEIPARPDFVPETLVGTVLDGRYRLLAHLATGGMGAVFRAEHIYMRKAVALKVLRPELSAVPEIVERFRREAEIAASLEHENIVRVTDFGKSPDGHLFLVMELLEGESLFDRMARTAPMDPDAVIHILSQVCAGLDVAHRRAVVHRDLKPENIFLAVTPGGGEVAKILDFGIAKITDPTTASSTQSGLVVGTPEYLSPEQALGLAIDPRADLYALGLIAWRMLVGRHPFKAPEARALLMMQATRPVPSVVEARGDLTSRPGLVAAIARACAKGAADRHADALELRRALEGARTGTPRTGTPPVRHLSPPATAFGIPAPRSANLAIMFTDIKDFTLKSARQTREENARMLGRRDRLLGPLIKSFGGKRVKSIGDGLLATFRSPTDAVLCGCAIQDRLTELNAEAAEAERFELRVAINLGEVRLSRGDIHGEPVNIASRVEGIAEPGEVWFTEALYLAMSKAEVPHEEIGTRELKGVPQPIRLYRVLQAQPEGEGSLPYGGVALKQAGSLETLSSVLAWDPDRPIERIRSRIASRIAAVRSLWAYAVAQIQGHPALAAMALVSVLLLVAGVWVLRERIRPENRAVRLIEEGQHVAAIDLLERELRETPGAPRLHFLMGRTFHRVPGQRARGLEHYEKAGPAQLDDDDALRDIAADMGDPDPTVAARAVKLLAAVGAPATPIAVETASLESGVHKLRALDLVSQLNASDRIDRVRGYAELLKGVGPLGEEECQTRILAARRLGEMGAGSVLPQLKALAQSRVPKKGPFAIVIQEPVCGAAEARAAARKIEAPTRKQ